MAESCGTKTASGVLIDPLYNKFSGRLATLASKDPSHIIISQNTEFRHLRLYCMLYGDLKDSFSLD